MAVLAGTVWNGGHEAGLVATVMLFLFNFFFGVGLLATAWLCTSAMLQTWVDEAHADNDSACGIRTLGDSDSCSVVGNSHKL